MAMQIVDSQKVVNLGKPFFNKLGNLMSDMIRDETTVKGQSVHGHKFPPLSETYAQRKAAGKFKRQSEASARANLVLTFDMMQDLQVVRATRKMVRIGWNAVESAKIQGYIDMGRPVTLPGKPVSKTVLAMAMGRMNRQVKLNINKYADGNKMTWEMGKK